MLLLRNADLYAPAPFGRTDVLTAGGQILRIEPRIQIPEHHSDVFDASDLVAMPGFVDGHVNMIGGGGEGGYLTRTPELSLSDAVRDAVAEEGVPLGTALQVVTSNPARFLTLREKGRLAAGADADLVLLDPGTLEIRGVIAKGRWLLKSGDVLAKGTFA